MDSASSDTTTWFRFVPATHYTRTETISFLFWDRTMSFAGSFADTGFNGGRTALSSVFVDARLLIS